MIGPTYILIADHFEELFLERLAASDKDGWRVVGFTHGAAFGHMALLRRKACDCCGRLPTGEVCNVCKGGP